MSCQLTTTARSAAFYSILQVDTAVHELGLCGKAKRDVRTCRFWGSLSAHRRVQPVHQCKAIEKPSNLQVRAAIGNLL